METVNFLQLAAVTATSVWYKNTMQLSLQQVAVMKT